MFKKFALVLSVSALSISAETITVTSQTKQKTNVYEENQALKAPFECAIYPDKLHSPDKAVLSKLNDPACKGYYVLKGTLTEPKTKIDITFTKVQKFPPLIIVTNAHGVAFCDERDDLVVFTAGKSRVLRKIGLSAGNEIACFSRQRYEEWVKLYEKK